MPNAANRPCRDPQCVDVAVSRRGWCAFHDQGAFDGGRPMAPGWGRLRALVLERDGHRCVLCGAPATEVDHVRPRVAGGTDHPANLRSLCHRCHARRTGRQGRGAR